MQEEKIEYQEEVYHTKFLFFATLGATVFVLLAQIFDAFIFKFFAVFAILAIPLGIHQIIFHGSTAIAIRLGKTTNQAKNFQYAVSIFYPLIASFYFAYNMTNIDFSVMLNAVNWSPLAIKALILYALIFWVGKNFQPYSAFSVRTFISLAGTLFIIMFLFSYSGIYFEENVYGDGNSAFIDKDQAEFNKETGVTTIYYLVSVFASYGAVVTRKIMNKR